MKILGIDQSLTSTGWVLLEDGEVVKYGLITSDKNKSNFQRAIDVADQISWEECCHLPDKIVMEGLPFMSRSNVTRDLAGLQFLVVDRLTKTRRTVEDLGIIPPTKLKKFATGSGKASKEEMYEALPPEVKAKFSSTLKTKGRYDLTDSYWLALHGEQHE